jgi:glycosyltransferase involved in cell wall biosynthesis
MKVLYDHQIFVMQRYGGISRYFFELIKNINQNNDISYELSIAQTNNYFINSSFLADKSCLVNKSNKRFSSPIRKIFGQEKDLNLELSKKKLIEQDFDIFHPTYYNPYFLNYIWKKPFVLTIHDMIHEIFPEYYSLADPTSLWKRTLAERANKIIAVTENTKKDIIKFLEISSSKVNVIHHGVLIDAKNENMKDTAIHFSLPEKYLIFVGSRERYKNFYFFIGSIAPFLLKNEKIFVVCAGGGSFSIEEMAFLRRLNIDSKVTQYDVTDDELIYLYKNAICFVFPSLYEGFGMPILESFACGCPVIASYASSLPEIGGDAAAYFDPKDTISLRDSVEKVINDRVLQENMKLKGYEQLKKFSWEKTAKETKNLYKSIYNKNNY